MYIRNYNILLHVYYIIIMCIIHIIIILSIHIKYARFQQDLQEEHYRSVGSQEIQGSYPRKSECNAETVASKRFLPRYRATRRPPGVA